jgi:hypothetical protein
MNSVDHYVRNFLYKEFPEFFVWDSSHMILRRRMQKIIQIERLVSAHPAKGERFYLRILLNHVKGATTFEDLQTVNSVALSTFREAAEKMGLIEVDGRIFDCLNKATTFRMPSALRRIFAIILVFCEVTNVRELWDKHSEAMGENFRMETVDVEVTEQMVLRDLRSLLYSMERT